MSDAYHNEYNDPALPALVSAANVWPEESRDFSFDLHSVSTEGQQANAYILLKDYICSELLCSRHPGGRPEPENVAEYGSQQTGGQLASVNITGIGPDAGCDSQLPKWVEVCIEFDCDDDGELETIVGNRSWGGPGAVYLESLKGKYVKLANLLSCQDRQGKISLHLSDIAEEEFGLNCFANNDLPFNDWPTNAFMDEKIEFSIEFALTQEPIPVGSYFNTP